MKQPVEGKLIMGPQEQLLAIAIAVLQEKQEAQIIAERYRPSLQREGMRIGLPFSRNPNLEPSRWILLSRAGRRLIRKFV